MHHATNPLFGCQPSRYQIKINGIVHANWSDWFSGMEISTEKDGEGSQVTILTGMVADQAALRGILCRIWDLNLTVLSVLRVDIGVVRKESE